MSSSSSPLHNVGSPLRSTAAGVDDIDVASPSTSSLLLRRPSSLGNNSTATGNENDSHTQKIRNRRAAFETTSHGEKLMLEMKNCVKKLNSSQISLSRSLEPLLEESELGQRRLQENILKLSNQHMEGCMAMIKNVEATMFDYAHEKARNAMLLDLVQNGAPDEYIAAAKKELSGSGKGDSMPSA